VIKCVINFRFHLFRSNPDFPSSTSNVNASMEMKELEISYNTEYEMIVKSTGRDIFERDPAVVVVAREKRYGVTVNNHTSLPLYPHLFYFDPSELSIKPWYLSATGTGTSISTHQTDAPLPANSEFRIGYCGDGGVDPWEFMLREGESKDVGFFKLFVTTAPVSLKNIEQECPYGDAPVKRAGRVSAPLSGPRLEVLGVWDVLVKTVVQHEIGTCDGQTSSKR
ncbi:hypothetical protein P691DRAFT_675656, partial [Macrolepiota fuliginosa MF-IS2]